MRSGCPWYNLNQELLLIKVSDLDKILYQETIIGYQELENLYRNSMMSLITVQMQLSLVKIS